METVIPSTIQNNPELLGKVERAAKWLEKEVGDTSFPVKAEWNLAEDQNGCPVLELTISDWSGKAQERFSVTQLDNADFARIRLNFLWGDLLQVRSHEQHKKVQRLLDELEGEREWRVQQHNNSTTASTNT